MVMKQPYFKIITTVRKKKKKKKERKIISYQELPYIEFHEAEKRQNIEVVGQLLLLVK
jgi:hypothetical protein